VIGLIFKEKASIIKPVGTIFPNMIKMIVDAFPTNVFSSFVNTSLLQNIVFLSSLERRPSCLMTRAHALQMPSPTLLM